MIILFYQILVIWLAYNNANRIAEGKRIYHGLNGLIHLLAACLVLPMGWNLSLALLFLTRIVFDLSLNYFRKIALCYTSPKPKSIIDKIELGLFGRNSCTPKIVYLIIVVCLLIVK